MRDLKIDELEHVYGGGGPGGGGYGGGREGERRRGRPGRHEKKENNKGKKKAAAAGAARAARRARKARRAKRAAAGVAPAPEGNPRTLFVRAEERRVGDVRGGFPQIFVKLSRTRPRRNINSRAPAVHRRGAFV